MSELPWLPERDWLAYGCALVVCGPCFLWGATLLWRLICYPKNNKSPGEMGGLTVFAMLGATMIPIIYLFMPDWPTSRSVLTAVLTRLVFAAIPMAMAAFALAYEESQYRGHIDNSDYY